MQTEGYLNLVGQIDCWIFGNPYHSGDAGGEVL